MSNNYEPCPVCGERHKQCKPSEADKLGGFIPTPRFEQTFYVNQRLDGLNEVINEARTHWSRGRDHKKAQQEIVEWAILNAKKNKGLHPVSGPFHLQLHFSEPNTARDPDNIVSAKKFILDALQTMKIIPNDNQKYVLSFTESWGIEEKDKPVGVYITLIED